MAILIFLALFVPLSLSAAWVTAEHGDRRFLLKAVGAYWVVLAPLVAILNAWMPFAGGGDDETYFRLAGMPVRTAGEIFDFSRFVGLMDQPGYPWLISLLNTITGHNLLVIKWFNLFILILIGLTWYRIGMLLEGRTFARRMMLVILLLTPLWYYIFFNLKDLPITLLQSVFVLAVIHVWNRVKLRPVIELLLFTFALLLFRAPLVLQNGAVLLGSLGLKTVARGAQGQRLVPIVLVAMLLMVAVPIMSNPALMFEIGITSEYRMLGSPEMLEAAVMQGQVSRMDRTLFPLLYLLSDVSGLSPNAWARLDARWLRGVLALSWIFFIVPFFLLGLRWLLRSPEGIPRANSPLARLRQARCIATPWSVLLLFVVTSVAISWTVGDTTRWRVPDMPMVAAIATAGWMYSSQWWRQYGIFFWCGIIGLLFSLLFLVRG